MVRFVRVILFDRRGASAQGVGFAGRTLDFGMGAAASTVPVAIIADHADSAAFDTTGQRRWAEHCAVRCSILHRRGQHSC